MIAFHLRMVYLHPQSSNDERNTSAKAKPQQFPSSHVPILGCTGTVDDRLCPLPLPSSTNRDQPIETNHSSACPFAEGNLANPIWSRQLKTPRSNTIQVSTFSRRCTPPRWLDVVQLYQFDGHLLRTSNPCRHTLSSERKRRLRNRMCRYYVSIATLAVIDRYRYHYPVPLLYEVNETNNKQSTSNNSTIIDVGASLMSIIKGSGRERRAYPLERNMQLVGYEVRNVPEPYRS
jgi:hypothetical protein